MSPVSTGTWITSTDSQVSGEFRFCIEWLCTSRIITGTDLPTIFHMTPQTVLVLVDFATVDLCANELLFLYASTLFHVLCQKVFLFELGQ